MGAVEYSQVSLYTSLNMISSFCGLHTTANLKDKVANDDIRYAQLVAQTDKVAERLPVTLQTAVLG